MYRKLSYLLNINQLEINDRDVMPTIRANFQTILQHLTQMYISLHYATQIKLQKMVFIGET